MAEGEINELHVGLKGTMNALFFKDLGQKFSRWPFRTATPLAAAISALRSS
jgi:hypothetical protein